MNKNIITPFWSWNDRLEKEELVRQIELMKLCKRHRAEKKRGFSAEKA